MTDSKATPAGRYDPTIVFKEMIRMVRDRGSYGVSLCLQGGQAGRVLVGPARCYPMWIADAMMDNDTLRASVLDALARLPVVLDRELTHPDEHSKAHIEAVSFIHKHTTQKSAKVGPSGWAAAYALLPKRAQALAMLAGLAPGPRLAPTVVVIRRAPEK